MMLKSNLVTQNSLVIMLWNANGIVQKKNEFEIFLHVNVVDVAIITETHLTYSKSFKIPGYKIYTTEHPDGTAHGGRYDYNRKFLPAIRTSVIPYKCFSDNFG